MEFLRTKRLRIEEAIISNCDSSSIVPSTNKVLFSEDCRVPFGTKDPVAFLPFESKISDIDLDFNYWMKNFGLFDEDILKIVIDLIIKGKCDHFSPKYSPRSILFVFAKEHNVLSSNGSCFDLATFSRLPLYHTSNCNEKNVKKGVFRPMDFIDCASSLGWPEKDGLPSQVIYSLSIFELLSSFCVIFEGKFPSGVDRFSLSIDMSLVPAYNKFLDEKKLHLSSANPHPSILYKDGDILGIVRRRNVADSGYFIARENEKAGGCLLILVWYKATVDILQISDLKRNPYCFVSFQRNGVFNNEMILQLEKAVEMSKKSSTDVLRDEIRNENQVDIVYEVKRIMELGKSIPVSQYETMVMSPWLMELLGFPLNPAKELYYVDTSSTEWYLSLEDCTSSFSSSTSCVSHPISLPSYSHDNELEDGEINEADDVQTEEKMREVEINNPPNKATEESIGKSVDNSSDLFLNVEELAKCGGYWKTSGVNYPLSVAALDCEMCTTAVGMELIRITLISPFHGLVYDKLVKPTNEILDYNTEFSGITEAILSSVTFNLSDIWKDLRQIIDQHTILIGHSLESDFRALRLIHRRVVDSSVVFPHVKGLPYKLSLKSVASEHLGRTIQEDEENGHDSVQDSCVALELVMSKILNPSLGSFKGGEGFQIPRSNFFQKLEGLLNTVDQKQKTSAQRLVLNVPLLFQCFCTSVHEHLPSWEKYSLGYRPETEFFQTVYEYVHSKENRNESLGNDPTTLQFHSNVLELVANQGNKKDMMSKALESLNAWDRNSNDHSNGLSKVMWLEVGSLQEQEITQLYTALPNDSLMCIFTQNDIWRLRHLMACKLRYRWESNKSDRPTQWDESKETELIQEARNCISANLFLRHKKE